MKTRTILLLSTLTLLASCSVTTPSGWTIEAEPDAKSVILGVSKALGKNPTNVLP